MKMYRVNLQLPQALKAKLDGMRSEGFTVAGYVRRLVEIDLQSREAAGRLIAAHWVPGQGREKKAGRKSARRSGG